MIGFFSRLLGGNKSDKDVKKIQPIVGKINEAVEQLKGLSHDDLRAKTDEFRKIIAEKLAEVDQELDSLKKQIEDNPDALPAERESLYQEIDKIQKNRNEKLETVLDEILPEAFA